MTRPTLKQLIEKATPLEGTIDAALKAYPHLQELHARCSPSVMLSVVEALENAISIMRADAKQFREQSDGRMAMASDAAAERWESALNALNGKAP